MKQIRIKYIIPTYNATSLCKYATLKANEGGNKEYTFFVDGDQPREIRRYIKNTSLYDDTAMFYQIQKVLEHRNTALKTEKDCPERDTVYKSLKEYLIFVDFENLFDFSENENEDKEDRELKLKSIFKNGLYISYNQVRYHFVPYDKSNSMSRQSKISFINEEIKEELDQRLNLDIDFSKIKLQLSKYYAYKGLYLSSAIRIDPEILELNSEKVIVIGESDLSWKLCGQNVITATHDVAEKLGRPKKWNVEEKKKTIELNVFDGEGIISPAYSDKINHTDIRLKNASSYQIRMPFAKGMLHKVDFKAFIKEFTGETERFMIKDAFGIERNLLKADIILSESMFKCIKWHKEDEIFDIDGYFDMLAKYDHALYISNTDKIYGNSNTTTLNYQILNTLDLTNEEMEGLVNEHISYATDSSKLVDAKTDFDDEEKAHSWFGDNLEYALSRNPVFVHENKINSILSSLCFSRKKDIALGRISVKGEIRYLSRDLLSFLVALLEINQNLEDSVEKKEVVERIKQNLMFEDEFFMPQSNFYLKIWHYYPIFRNPHLSRNEQCALKPYFKEMEQSANDLYYKYLGHLKGVIMVHYHSLDPLALGGADFDGDTVKIIDDERVRNAVLRGVYEKNPQEKGRRYIRKLPIIEIPSDNSATKVNVGKNVDYDTIKNTFSNQIGQLSNLAIRIGKKEYASEDAKPKHSCVECTILTGLEIDAAKNGSHPDLTEIKKYGRDITSDSDYIHFNNQVKKMTQHPNFHYYLANKYFKMENDTIEINQGTNKTFQYQVNEEMTRVERLPGYFIESLDKKLELSGEKVNNKYLYFDFLKDHSWKKNLDEEKRVKIAAIMSAYNKICSIHSKAEKKRNQLKANNFEGYIMTLFNIQYDVEKYDSIRMNEYVDMCAYIEEILNTPEKLNNAKELLESSNWSYMRTEEEKKAFLIKVFGKTLRDDIEKLVSNFYFNGYTILYYAICDELSLLADRSSAVEFRENENEDTVDESKLNKEIYEKTYQNLENKYVYLMKIKADYWKNQLMEDCNKEIKSIMEGMEEDKKLMLLWSLNGKTKADKSGEFFWNLVSRESLEKHIMKEGD